MGITRPGPHAAVQMQARGTATRHAAVQHAWAAGLASTANSVSQKARAPAQRRARTAHRTARRGRACPAERSPQRLPSCACSRACSTAAPSHTAQRHPVSPARERTRFRLRGAPLSHTREQRASQGCGAHRPRRVLANLTQDGLNCALHGRLNGDARSPRLCRPLCVRVARTLRVRALACAARLQRCAAPRAVRRRQRRRWSVQPQQRQDLLRAALQTEVTNACGARHQQRTQRRLLACLLLQRSGAGLACMRESWRRQPLAALLACTGSWGPCDRCRASTSTAHPCNS